MRLYKNFQKIKYAFIWAFVCFTISPVFTQTRLLDVNKTELQLIKDSSGFDFQIDVLPQCFIDSLSDQDVECLGEWQSLFDAFPCNFGYLYVFACRGSNKVQVFQGLSVNNGMRGAYAEFYPNGYRKNALVFYYNKTSQNVFDGKAEFYYPFPSLDTVDLTDDHGQVQSLVEFRKGFLWTVKTIFSNHGKKLKVGSFKNGKGQLNFYDNESRLYATLTFVAGRSNGLAKFYSTDGEFYTECTIKNGIISGLCTVYNREKEIVRTFNHKSLD